MEPIKPPVELVVIVVGVVVIAEPSYDIVIPEFAAKLLPEMFTVVPVGPLVGFSDIDGVVTVNCADAEVDDGSVALIALGPGPDDGAEMEALEPPAESAVTVV